MAGRRRVGRRALTIGGFALYLDASILIVAARRRPAWGGDAAPRTGSIAMRVTFEAPSTGVGYFPGLAKPVVIDADRLAAAEVLELSELVAGARFFDQPARVGSPPTLGGADRRQFVITVEAGGRRHTVQLLEPVGDPGLGRLLRFLEAKANAIRAPARPPQGP